MSDLSRVIQFRWYLTDMQRTLAKMETLLDAGVCCGMQDKRIADSLLSATQELRRRIVVSLARPNGGESGGYNTLEHGGEGG